LAFGKIFFAHSGPVSYKIIDRILKDLKKSGEFIKLRKTTAKRIYSILVEILENIAKHSVRKSTGTLIQPFVSLERRNDKIIIRAGNPITDDRKEMLAAQLDLVNHLDEAALRLFYEDKINRKSKKNENGAGLGFIIMRLKSGNKIDFSFSEAAGNISNFSIQITVNIFIMRKLLIERTASSPKVMLDPDNNFFEISGESRPSDVDAFYNEILSWFDDYSQFLFKSQQASAPPVFNLDFEYFNSSSAKYILDFCKLIAAMRSKGSDVTVKWHYESDDQDMLETGKEMSRISKMPFEYVQKDLK